MRSSIKDARQGRGGARLHEAAAADTQAVAIGHGKNHDGAVS